jgi:hypothetical protein
VRTRSLQIGASSLFGPVSRTIPSRDRQPFGRNGTGSAKQADDSPRAPTANLPKKYAKKFLINKFARRFVMVATVKINKPDRYISSQGADNTRSLPLRNNAPEYGRSTNAKNDPDNFGLSAAGLFDDPGRFGGGASSPNGAPRPRADQ